MNIILAEERAGRLRPEISFSKESILVGRDPTACDVVFESDEFPMVSRRHAEIRWQGGRWLLIDQSSRFGTILDGVRIGEPTPLNAGSRIQFGGDGPLLRVVWFEVAAGATGDLHRGRSAQNISPVAQPFSTLSSTLEPSAAIPQTGRLAAESPSGDGAQLDFLFGRPRPSFRLEKSSVWLGRDPDCDVTFDASAAVVSRKHAEIRQDSEGFVLVDNQSFNGTLVNRQRITATVPLYHNDEIQLGVGGPLLRFNSPSRPAPTGASLAGHRSFLDLDTLNTGSQTMTFRVDQAATRVEADPEHAQLLMSINFANKRELTVGRDDANDIKLDGLQISNKHARLTQRGDDVVIEDLNSTNGVYVNGERVSRGILTPQSSAQIGSFMILVNDAGSVGVFDTRSKHRIDVVNISKEVKNRGGGGRTKLLDSISLSIPPNEFVGILGPSGAGKSTLIKAMNGVRPATSGNVLINNLDLYQQFDSLKQAVGYVPQEDVLHRELTVYRTLYYVAKLRLSRDISKAEIDQIINEVLDVTGLTERRNMPVGRLSGGQRKRVSIAVELVTKPSVIFLDEPTSGLDPGTEERIMKLFRQIAESGRTVVMTTHAMENIKLFDKIVLMMRGRLVFYGRPDDALRYLGASNFKELFDRLQTPVEEGVRQQGEASRGRLTEQTAEVWQKRFLDTPQHGMFVKRPLEDLGKLEHTAVHKKRRLGIAGAISQWITLSRRYLEVLLNDRLNLFILLGQAPVIAVLTFFAMGPEQPRDFLYFVVALVAIWFGTSVAAREIIRERPVYRRERMFNLGILPYLASKFTVLSVIVGLQCMLLFWPLKLMDFAGYLKMPGEKYGTLQFAAMLLTAAVGVALGLLVSALVRTSEMATSLVPLILIPQILFSGLIGVPSGVNQFAGLAMPAAWSFDTMKRYSTLDTLEPEGANPRGATKGLGLYKSIETENEKTINRAKRDLEDLKRISGRQFLQESSGSSASERAGLGQIQKIPPDLSDYVMFLNPWMDEILNQIVLVLMFGLMVLITLVILRLQDVV